MADLNPAELSEMFEAWLETEDGKNAFMWAVAGDPTVTKSSMWGAFVAGWRAAQPKEERDFDHG